MLPHLYNRKNNPKYRLCFGPDFFDHYAKKQYFSIYGEVAPIDYSKAFAGNISL